LRNTAALQGSFEVQQRGRAVTLYSRSPIAIYHEYGTGTYAGKRKYPITAKHAKALAIPTGEMTLAGLGRSTRTRTGGFIFAPATGQKRIPKRLRGRVGKTVRPYKSMVFRKSVMHPGVPARPMLPDPKRLVPKLQAAADKLTREMLDKKGIVAR
jgi:hypothetical protein